MANPKDKAKDGNKGASTAETAPAASTAPNASAAASPAAPSIAPAPAAESAPPAADAKPAREHEGKSQAELFTMYSDGHAELIAAQKKIDAAELEIATRLHAKSGKITLPDRRVVRARFYEKTGRLILTDVGAADDCTI